jgi:DNA invertase Pin-like site-specific DNA recombinase
MGQIVGYTRVSTADQNDDGQKLTLNAAGATRIFSDRITGSAESRPALDEMSRYVREGDTIVIYSIDRLARNVEHLLSTVKAWREQGIAIVFIRESLRIESEPTPMTELLLGMIGHIAQFEKSIIKERQREGIEAAKARGAYKGRKRVLDEDKLKEFEQLKAQTGNISEIARRMGVSRQTIYRYMGEQ